MTQCNQESFAFHRVGRREVVAKFDGGRISSDGGAVLLREVERRTAVIEQFIDCFTDHRSPVLIEHDLEHLIAQRVMGLALGYEDLNDHDRLRHDPLLAVAIGHRDPLGGQRRDAEDRGKPLAGKSTLNRIELSGPHASRRTRYKKISFSTKAFDRLLTDLFIQAQEADGRPEQIVLDFDATDATLHGNQLGVFFHGYYDSHCYLPLYVTCGEHVLCAKLRPSNIDASAGSLAVLRRIVEQVRAAWPGVRIVVRGDSGFCRENLMKWCEQNDVDFTFGLAKNERLTDAIEQQMDRVKRRCERTREAARQFVNLKYRTTKSWSRERRVVAKSEHLPGERGANPRFVVTSISARSMAAQSLYEDHYCARGDMENRIKEQQLGLFADRMSAGTMRANQIRLAMSTIAYTLMARFRQLGLRGTEMAQAQCGTIRTRLLKIGARVSVTARKIWVSLSESFPLQHLFVAIYHRLGQTTVRPLGP